MNNEQKFLVNICNCYLNKERLTIHGDIDTKTLYTLAKNHNLIGICHCVFNENKDATIDEKTRQVFLNSFFDLVYIYTLQSAALNDINTCLTDAGIRYIPFKGSVLRDIYPVAESRSMGDIDILIEIENRDKADTALKRAGFECYAPNGAVREYKRDNIILEVHTKILPELDYAFCDAFDNAVFDGCVGRLDDSYHFAYLIAHLAHHFRFYGAGIKLILDLAVMLKNCAVDIDRVRDLLAPLGLTRFFEEISSVCYIWFHVGKCYNTSTEKTQEYLLKYGAFGSLNENKGSKIARDNLKQGKNTSPLTMKLRLAFPSYNKMKDIPYIRFIEGRPWLTPYAWCYRFIYNFKNRRQFTFKTLNDIDDEKTAFLAKEELSFFEEIGL